MNLSIIIPAYNETSNIEVTIRELLDAVKKIPWVEHVRVTVIDDHSSDDTYDVCGRMKNAQVTCLRLSKRCGSHVALRAGLKEAGGDAVLCVAADGQEDPKAVKDMLLKWKNGTRVVWALRKDRKNEPWYIRKPAQVFYRIMFWLAGTEFKQVDLYRADFFLLDKAVVAAINSCPERNTSLMGMLVWLGFDQDCVEYERRTRHSGLSKWTLSGRLHLARDWVVAFSGVPLRLMSILGFFIAVFGFTYGIYVVINSILGQPVHGWSSTITAVLLLGGIQMIMLGIIGEYLWRNLDESRKRPLYFVERKS